MNANATDNAQAAWDAEDADAFRRGLLRVTKSILAAERDYLAASRSYRDARKRQQRAEQDVTDCLANAAGQDALAFDRRLRQLDRAVEAAQDRVRETRDAQLKAARRRLELWAERRAKMKKRYEYLPLFDRPAEEAGGDDGDTASVRVEEATEPCPHPIEDREGVNCHACHDDERGLPAPGSPLDAHPCPGGLTAGVLHRAYVAGLLASHPKKPAKLPHKVDPFEDEGRLWVCVAGSDATADLLPLVPAKEFAERWPDYPTKYVATQPSSGAPEAMLQLYTGIVVRAGRKEYVIAPAGEGRTITKPKE